MSARIRTSSLFSRKYDWIFCESTKQQRPRTLHSLKPNEALLRIRKVLDESHPEGRRRLPISKIPTKPGSKAEKARIHRVTVDTPVRPPQFVRALKGRSRLGTSWGRISGHVSQDGRKGAVITGEFEDFNEIPYTVRRLDATEKPATPVRLARWALLRREQLRRASVKQDSSIVPQEARIWRYQTREEDPHKQTFRISKHIAKDPDNPPVFRSEGRRRLRETATTASKAFTFNGEARNLPEAPVKSFNLEQAQGPTEAIAEPAEPLELIDRNQVRYARIDPNSLNRLSYSAKAKFSKRDLKNLAEALRRQELGKSTQKVTTEKHSLLRASPTEISPSNEDVQQNSIGKETFFGIRRYYMGPTEEQAPPLKVRKHLSVSLKDRPFEKTEAQKVAEQDRVAKLKGTLKAVPGPKITKYGSTRLRKFISERTTFAQPVIDLQDSRFEQPVMISGLRPFTIPNVVSAVDRLPQTTIGSVMASDSVSEEEVQPLTNERPMNLVVQKAAKRVSEQDEKQAKKLEKKAKQLEKKAQKLEKKAKKLEQKEVKKHGKKVENEVEKKVENEVKKKDKKLEKEAKKLKKMKAKKLGKKVEKEVVNTVATKVATSPKEAQQPVTIRRAVGFDSVPGGKGQPLTIKRPENLVVQKVATLLKELPDPPENPTDSPSVRAYMSTSQYPIPTEETRMFSEIEPERETIKENPPASTYHWTPTERIEHAVEVASSKRLQRESWLTRKGDMRLAISLLFSPRSMANVQRLRWKYNPNKEKFANFKVLRRLEVGRYNEYATTLASFVQTWQPFSVNLNEPGHTKDKKSSFKVGLKLEFEKLEQLETALLESVKSLSGTTNVNRRNTRDNDELGLMVIDGKIKEAQDAAQLVELLKKEHEEGLGSLRAEGLVLHGYANGGDSLFPPPKEFLFLE